MKRFDVQVRLRPGTPALRVSKPRRGHARWPGGQGASCEATFPSLCPFPCNATWAGRAQVGQETETLTPTGNGRFVLRRGERFVFEYDPQSQMLSDAEDPIEIEMYPHEIQILRGWHCS